MPLKSISNKLTVTIAIALVATMNSCAALQPSDTNGPRANVAPYPIVVNEPSRLEAATLGWQQLSQRYGLPLNSTADLQPLTATLQSISSNAGSSIFLPKVGSSPKQSEEETRESLRRFIADWRALIGADRDQLSLVERTDNASGIKVARYEQRPFRYPIRGNFGNLIIRFSEDRRVIDVNSTCLPNADRLQAALAGLTPQVTVENAAALIKGHSITAADSAGQQHTFALSESQVIEVRQLVAYVTLSPERDSVELHLAWEIDVTNGPIKTIYLDAMSKQVLAVA